MPSEPTTTDLPRFVKLSTETLEPVVLGECTFTGTLTGTGTSIPLMYWQLGQREASENQTPVWVGETAGTTGTTAAGTDSQYIQLTITPEKPLADGIRIYKGSTSTVYLYSDCTISYNGTGNISGVTTTKGSIGTFGTGTYTWIDTTPNDIPSSGTGTGTTNKAQKDTIILTSPISLDKPFVLLGIPKDLAAGQHGAYRKGWRYNPAITFMTTSTAEENDIIEVLNFPYLKFYPEQNTNWDKNYKCTIGLDFIVDLQGEFYASAKSYGFTLEGMDVFQNIEVLF